MRIETLPVSRINPAPYNPRVDLRPGDPEYEKIARSIGEFGCVEPLVWNERSGALVGGHQRLKVLLARGAAEVTVSVVDLDPNREKALNLALNKAVGAWDEPRLAALLDELTRLPDFDLSITGFDAPEADELIARTLRALDRDEAADPDDAFLAEGEPITARGDVIELGDARCPHRVMCGDSSDPADAARLLGGATAQLLFTDPPYNVDYYGGDRPTPAKARPKPSRRWTRIYGDDLPQERYEQWLRAVLTNARAALNPGAAVYVWNGHRQFASMHATLEALGVRVSCVLTWAKETFAIGYGDYHQQTEFCLYGWKDGAAHRWHGPANASTLWRVDRDPTSSYVHPTQKPLELAERALRHSTRAGEAVLDCFLGSGTTLIAAERTGRRCLGMEIEPRWVDAIVRRYIAFAPERVPDDLKHRYTPPDATPAPGSNPPVPGSPARAVPTAPSQRAATKRRTARKAAS